MVIASRWAKAAISLLPFVAVLAYVPSGVNSDTPANKGSFPFSVLVTSTSGPEMYEAYCTGCHGKDGRGKTIAARYCTVPPADLSQLARNNGGIYPAKKVCQILQYGTGKTAEGQGYMPVWEPLLKSMNDEPPWITKARIYNLADYVGMLQDYSATPRKRLTPVR